MEFEIEVVVVPVSDVGWAKDFHTRIGFREDVDFSGPGGFRIVHLTSPGSVASLIIGSGVTDAAPGSERGVHLIVDDVVAARAEWADAGVEVSEVFHDAGGVFHHAGTAERVAGPHPGRQSYSSFTSFADPDGNTFVLQEVTARRSTGSLRPSSRSSPAGWTPSPWLWSSPCPPRRRSARRPAPDSLPACRNYRWTGSATTMPGPCSTRCCPVRCTPVCETRSSPKHAATRWR
ncbi:VOC family protein [Kitasatospora aureofaciens]|uniref:hypothetical protein n=1 Tax=Kitasatospora aureofaciens TaxID=1894 RepID=UPI0036F49646